jgi:hypothetical protein
MGIVRAIRMLNAATSGNLTGAQIETLLTTGDRLGEWEQLLALRGQAGILAASSDAMTAVAASSTAMTAVAASSTARAAVNANLTALAAVEASTPGLVAWITVPAGLTPTDYADMTAVAASSTAMAAVAASSTAMAAVAASSTAMAAVAASSTAMAAVAASSTAMDAIGESVTAKEAVWASDTALSAIQASTTAMASLRGAAGYGVESWTENGTSDVAISLSGARYILLGVSRNTATNRTATMITLRSESTQDNFGSTGTSTRTDAQAVDLAAPVQSPFRASLSASGTGTGYLGLLRVDA